MHSLMKLMGKETVMEQVVLVLLPWRKVMMCVEWVWLMSPKSLVSDSNQHYIPEIGLLMNQ